MGREHIIQSAIQLAGVLVLVGLPLLYWGNTINSQISAMAVRIDREDRDISVQQSYQSVVTTQMLDVNKALARIDAQLSDIRENSKRLR